MEESASPPSMLQQGITVIQKQLKTMGKRPGVYRMLDAKKTILYVGKAKNLFNRIQHYTQPNRLSYRIQTMVAQTHSMEIVSTETETEALLLEASLIKRYKPRYNILLKDDKSFPYILITTEHPFPQCAKHRGNRAKKGHYFGPFASASAVNETLDMLQKIFMLRPCSDAYFASRTKPCMYYQIKRCSAPCVDKVTQEQYQESTNHVIDFLSGKSTTLQERLHRSMQEASMAMEYEKAAMYRDRIKALTHIQQKQLIHSNKLQDADIIGIAQKGNNYSIQIFFFRGGNHYGNSLFFPEQTDEQTVSSVLESFLLQFYQTHTPPSHIYSNALPESQDALEQALTQLREKKVSIHTPKSGEKKHITDAALNNATEALERKSASESAIRENLIQIAELFDIGKIPERIEVYDNSHLQGTHPKGAMIVAGQTGFIKKAYRHFNLSQDNSDKPVTGGDDYAMLREVLTRRLKRLLSQAPEYVEGVWPDLLLIDGGKGHFRIASTVLDELNLTEKITLACIAKGEERDAGNEMFFCRNIEPFSLDNDNPTMRYLQQLRDEAHRFAIQSHRKKRSKAISTTKLDTIPGIGAKRKKALLHHFGSAELVTQASRQELEKVPHISKNIAEVIYQHLHDA